jgi:hypothetical protein
MHGLTLLKNSEIKEFDSPPRFTEEERGKFFFLPENEERFRKKETKIGYILLEGYFMSRQEVFPAGTLSR